MWKKALVVLAAAVVVAGCGPDRSSPSVTSDAPSAVVATSEPPTPSAVPSTTTPPVVQVAPTQPPAPATTPQRVATQGGTAQGTSGGGTGSCGQDYYRNSDGACVHRPASGPGAPAGATARCNDGTYSYSTHRSGTCSHHGGVAAWL